MEKNVKSGERVTHITLDGTECAVHFSAEYRVFCVKSESSDILVSLKSGAVKGDDGTLICPSGGSVAYPHMRLLNTVYLTGSGDVTVFAGNEADANPFKSAAQGGGEISADGEMLTMNGLQGGVPFSEVVVSGKNLIHYPYDNTTKTVNGITFTDNGDGSVTVNGTATAGVPFYFINKKVPTFPIDRTYFLSGCPVDGSDSTFDLFFASFNKNGAIVDIYGDTGSGTVVNISENVTAINIYIRIREGVTVNNLVFRPMLELGDTATEYVQPITGQELTLTVCGKNLFHCNGLSTFTKNGITFTVNGDGTYTLNGTATDSASFSIRVDNIKHSMKIGETYTFKALPDEYVNNNDEFCYLFTYSETGGSIKDFVTDENGRGETFTLTACNVITFGLNIPSGTVFNNLVIKPQLELGRITTDYEPYNGAEYIITPDSNPYTIPTEIYQQDGINRVCVTGNGEPNLSVVTGVKENATIKKIWDKLLELETAIIVSNGEI